MKRRPRALFSRGRLRRLGLVGCSAGAVIHYDGALAEEPQTGRPGLNALVGRLLHADLAGDEGVLKSTGGNQRLECGSLLPKPTSSNPVRTVTTPCRVQQGVRSRLAIPA